MTAPGPAVHPEEVARAAVACPDVARLAEGAVAEVASYLPGRRVPGVRVLDDAVEVHIVARWGRPLPEVGEAVALAVAPVAGSRPVRVFVEDLDVPAAPPGASAATPSTGRRPVAAP